MPDISILVKAKDEASSVLKGIQNPLGGLSSAFSKLGILGPLSLGAVGAGIIKLGVDAANIEEVRRSFDNLAEDAGKDADQFLADLQRMSGGQVSQANLMMMTNKALIVSGTDVADRLPTYFAIARAASEATGESFEEMFQKLVMGIESGSTRMLRQLGLTINVDEAYKKYAASIGKSVDALTDLEKKQAAENAVMADADKMLERLGTTTVTTDDKLERFGAQVADLKLKLGTLLIPVLGTGIDIITALGESVVDMDEKAEDLTATLFESSDSAEDFALKVAELRDKASGADWTLEQLTGTTAYHAAITDFARRRTEELSEAEEAADTARRNAVKGIYEAAEALREQGKAAEMSAEDYEKLKDATKGLIGAMEELMFPDEAQAKEVSDLFYQMYVTENPRVIAAAQALEAERNASDESIRIAKETADGIGDIYENAQTRLEETRAGMHGVPDAYDVLAITSEAVAPYKSEWKNAQDAVETLEEEHLGRMAGLEAGYAATVSAAKKNIPAEWTSYLAEVEEAERIAAEARATAITDALREQQPDQYDVLAQMVRDGDVILSELPGMTRIHTEAAGVEFNKLALGIDEDITWANVMVAMKASEMKKSLVDDAFEPARKSVKDFRAEIDALDGTKVYVHIYEVHHTVQATEPITPH